MPRRRSHEADAILVLNAGSSSIKFSLFAERDGDARARRARPDRGLYTAPHFVARGRGRRDARREVLGRGRSSATTAPSRISRIFCAAHASGLELVGRRARVVHGGMDSRSRCGSTRDVRRRARKAHPAGAAAPAAQPGADPAPARAPARSAAGRVLRHRVPPHQSRRRAALRHCPRSCTTPACGATASTACPTSTSPRCCRTHDATRRGGQDRRAATSATARACARSRPAAASPARWASPPSTGCRWARAAARSIPACCSTSWTSAAWTRARSRSCSTTSRACSACRASPATCATLLALETIRGRKLAVDLYRLSHPARAGFARRRARRAGRARVHRRHRRERAAIRERVCRDAAWLGVELDAAANAAGGPRISTSGQPRVGVGDPDQRGTDDRPAHAAPACVEPELLDVCSDTSLARS